MNRILSQTRHMVGRQMMRNHSTKPDQAKQQFGNPKMVEYYKLQVQEIKRKQQLREGLGQFAKVIPYVIGTYVGIIAPSTSFPIAWRITYH